ncbi:alpha-hydroxy acid oxidase [Geodermatophilus sp. CPCC 206100]|uniref:alpha-hydroxy acid oxidase n=1 Tax=Geodermatophilus sp. CPCC 206100 TaxID=3020054 RepID=UPI003AFFF94A
MSRRAARAGSVAEMRELARRRLPRPVFDLVEGGAEDEVTLQRNSAAFLRARLQPRAFVDVAERDTATTVLGTPLRSPLLLAPTGAARVLHRDAELAVARAAAARGVGYVHGTVSGHPVEQVARVTGSWWYQLFLSADRGRVTAELDRVAALGCRVLVVTVDVPTFGNRERDRRHGLTLPVRLSPGLALHCATRPRWTAELLRGNLPQRGRPDGRVSPFATQGQILRSLYPVTEGDLAWLRGAWPHRLVVKGVMDPEDGALAVRHGADGVVVSNHGGRQLDRAPATLEALPGVVEAVAGRAEVLLDGGVRRGADVLTALGLGARAVLVGRPYLYGLAVAGQAGVERVIDVLTTELDRTMALTGVASVRDVGARTVTLGPPVAGSAGAS